MADSDHYCYGGSDVLVNRFGIRDAAVINAVERNLSEARIRDILGNPRISVNGWGLNTLSRIHRTLFGDIYAWAGHVRDGNIGKDGLGFCDSTKVKENLSRLRQDIASLPKGEGFGRFACDIAAIHAVLNSIHPFREGNGRTMRTFLTLYARSRGYDLDYGLYPKSAQIEADRQALSENPDSTSLALMYAAIASPYRGKQRIRVTEGSSVKEPLTGRGNKGIEHER